MGRRWDFVKLLEAGDVKGLMRAHAVLFPNTPLPESEGAVEITMHLARTASSSITFKARAYSHAWLTDRGLPSQLPDELRPKAEQMRPKVVDLIGVAVMAPSEALAPVAKEVEKAMANAAAVCQHDGVTDPTIIRAVMDDAKDRALRQMMG